MEKKGPAFYDEENVFKTYTAHRSRVDSPNETIEQPILWQLIGDPMNHHVLDLGCGDARAARTFRQRGANSYLGVEGSRRMAERAKANLEPGFSEIALSWLEDFKPLPEMFDLVTSSLAFHYIDDLNLLFNKVATSLKPGGRFVFSVEHPVITSCNKSLEESSVRQAFADESDWERRRRIPLFLFLAASKRDSQAQPVCSQ